MQSIGHVGGGLVLTAIVLLTSDDAPPLWFTAVAIPASVLPDIDLYLPVFVHQGVVHTYSVLVLVSIAGGLLAASVATAWSADAPPAAGHVLENPRRTFVLTTAAMITGTFSHVTLDMVAYRESFTSMPVEPLWPFTDWVPRVNIIPPHAPLWNYGLFALGVAMWVTVVGATRTRS